MVLVSAFEWFHLTELATKPAEANKNSSFKGFYFSDELNTFYFFCWLCASWNLTSQTIRMLLWCIKPTYYWVVTVCHSLKADIRKFVFSFLISQTIRILWCMTIARLSHRKVAFMFGLKPRSWFYFHHGDLCSSFCFCLQDMWGLRLDREECGGFRRDRTHRALERSCYCISTTFIIIIIIIRNTELLAGPPVSQLAACVPGVCLCHLLAISFQCSRLKVDTKFLQWDIEPNL